MCPPQECPKRGLSGEEHFLSPTQTTVMQALNYWAYTGALGVVGRDLVWVVLSLREMPARERSAPHRPFTPLGNAKRLAGIPSSLLFFFIFLLFFFPIFSFLATDGKPNMLHQLSSFFSSVAFITVLLQPFR